MIPNENVTLGVGNFLKKNKAGMGQRLFRNEEYMNENSILLFYYIYLIYVSFGIYLIHSKKESVKFNFLDVNFLYCQSGYFHENQPVTLIAIEYVYSWTGHRKNIKNIYSLIKRLHQKKCLIQMSYFITTSVIKKAETRKYFFESNWLSCSISVMKK